MERTVKLPKTFNPVTAIYRGISSPDSWVRTSGEKYLYLCRCRDVNEPCASFWSVGLFAGGKVVHGSVQYLVHPVNSKDGTKCYDADYTLPHDQAELIGIPCVYFTDDGNVIKGTLVSYYRDGDCGVLAETGSEIRKVEACRVRFISDILAMEG